MQVIKSFVLEYGPNVLAAFFIACVFVVAALLVKRAMSSKFAKGRIPEEMQNLLVRVLQVAILLIGILTVLDQLGVDITALVAGLGLAGLALSLAAQDTVANVIAGVSLVIDRPFREGDWIEVNGMHASVTAIRLRTTVLTTFDNEAMVMPNRTLAETCVVNYTYTPKIRVRVPVRIAYKEDIEKARNVLLAAVRDDARVLSEPAPAVWVTELAESSINLEFRFWVENSIEKYPVTWAYMEECERRLREAGIRIPFPQREIYVEERRNLQA